MQWRTSRSVIRGKTVYWIDYQRFENSKDKRDGREKAEKYCLDNYINPNDIQKFDSRTECARYEYLLEQQKKGLISNLAHHFKIKIQDEFTNANGDVIPAITYEADFIYYDVESKRRIVEDVKGSEYFIDERFITIKQVFDKLMFSKGLYIRVCLFKDNQWVEWHIGEKKKTQKLIKKQREEIHTLRQAQHNAEVLKRKRERELARMHELRELRDSGTKLTKAQRDRLDDLENRLVV